MFKIQAEILEPEILEDFRYELTMQLVASIKRRAIENIDTSGGAPVRDVLKARSGRLIRGIANGVVTANSNKTEFNLELMTQYGKIHEEGGEVQFNSKGKVWFVLKQIKRWYKTHGGYSDDTHGTLFSTWSVRIPARPYFRPAVLEARADFKEIARGLVQNYFRTKKVQSKAITIALGDFRRSVSTEVIVI